MIKIIGLGNPGDEYRLTRHNIGRIVLSHWQEKDNLSDFKKDKTSNSLISKNEGFSLILPETFMNSSGISVKKIIKNSDNLWVVHDDIDIPLGRIKISKNKYSGGHNGVQSIIDELKTKNFLRFRVGIGPNHIVSSENLPKFVLDRFTKEELKIIEETSDKLIQILKFTLKEGLEKTRNKFNRNDDSSQEN